MNEFWIVTSVFFFNTVFWGLLVYLFYRYKCQKLDTLLKLVESSGEIRPEIMEALSQGGGPTSDMRKGLIWLAIGIPFCAGLAVLADLGSAIIVGGVPLLIGVAYLIVMKFGYQDQRPNQIPL